MPRKATKTPVTIRVEKELLVEVREECAKDETPVTDAVEDGLRRWLKARKRNTA